MKELSSGTTITLRGGGTCVVERELGRGGQGIVYQVNMDGKPYALKWYTQSYDRAFYDNLARNAEQGSPSNYFLWPLKITEHQQGSFGYIMDLRPSRFKEIGQFLLAKARFKSMHESIVACLNICTAFQRLHANGYSYGDLNDGNFFIDPATGDVLICDNDNVVPDGQDVSGIIGKPGYMAPEIIEGASKPNRYSDYFSQAVILFLILLGNRPFEGAWAAACPCMTEKFEREINGFNAVFICDPDDSKNRPVRGLHNNVIRRWPLMPSLLRRFFEKAFGRDSITNPTARPMDRAWQKVMLQMMAMYVPCPICGKPTFIYIDQQATKCIECDHVFHRPVRLKIEQYEIPLVPGQEIREAMYNIDRPLTSVIGRVEPWPSDKRFSGIVNTSGTQWIATTPSGKDKVVQDKEMVPAKEGIKLRLPAATTRFEIIS